MRLYVFDEDVPILDQILKEHLYNCADDECERCRVAEGLRGAGANTGFGTSKAAQEGQHKGAE